MPERHRSLEYLDRGNLDPGERALSFGDLETISRLPGQFGPLWHAIRSLALAPEDSPPLPPLRLLELGSGTGAVGIRIARRLAAEGRDVELQLTDARPDLLPPARVEGRVRLTPAKLDVLVDPIPAADIVCANLLIHHLSEEGAVHMLAAMRAAARVGGVVFDLDRNRWSFTFLHLTLPLWVRSAITVADALSSVQQAFRRDELLAMARRAGIENPRCKRWLFLRTLLSWQSTSSSTEPGSHRRADRPNSS